MSNPLLQMALSAHCNGDDISSVSAELNDNGRWIATIRLSGLRRDSASRVDGVKMTAYSAPQPLQAMLPIGTSEEVVETWVREVAEVGDSRDYSRTSDGRRYLTFPARWGCDYRKQTAMVARTGYIFGDTYRLRAQLKSQGLKWAPKRKAWYGPLQLCRDLAESLDLTLWTKPPSCKLISVD